MLFGRTLKALAVRDGVLVALLGNPQGILGHALGLGQISFGRSQSSGHIVGKVGPLELDSHTPGEIEDFVDLGLRILHIWLHLFGTLARCFHRFGIRRPHTAVIGYVLELRCTRPTETNTQRRGGGMNKGAPTSGKAQRDSKIPEV